MRHTTAVVCGLAAALSSSVAFGADPQPSVIGAPPRIDYTRDVVSPPEDLYNRGLKAYVDGQFSQSCSLMMQAAVLGLARADISYRALQAMLTDSENRDCRTAARNAPRETNMGPVRERPMTR